MTGKTQKILSRTEAKRRLKVSAPVFDALRISGLLGPNSADGRVYKAGLEQFERYGTQWHSELDERRVPEEYYQNPQNSAEISEQQPPGTRTQGQILPTGVPDDPDKDTGWLAQFYLRPNRLFFPDPTELALIGPLPLKLSTPKKIREAEPPAWLYPDPAGSLGMVMVMGVNRPADDLFKAAYDVASPLLDELSFRYDQPLPIAHSLVVGIPSGAINVYFSKHPAIKTIDPGEEIPPSCPYPELHDAVALYREGISSNNPFHSFLTLWRTYENALGVRTEWRRQHQCSDTKIHDEVIPNIWVFRGRAGLSFDQVKQQLYRPYRVALAHGSNIREGRPRTAATAADFDEVSTKVVLIRYMARVVLENVRATLAASEGDSANS